MTHNHRQGNDKTYAETLNRLRIGEPTHEDKNILTTRVRPANHPDIHIDAMYVACFNESVNTINTNRIEDLPGEGVELNARHFTSTHKSFKPPISKNGNVHTTAFLDKLVLKPNARVMLIYNVNTSDSLTNGALGEVLGFERNHVRSDVTKVIVNFFNPECGKQLQDKSTYLLSNYPGKAPTPIGRVECTYTLSKKITAAAYSAKVFQFPLKLAFAATAHKFQGQTVHL